MSAMLYSRIKGLKFLAYFDMLIPSVALAQGFGRIGCFWRDAVMERRQTVFGYCISRVEVCAEWHPALPTQLISSGLDFCFSSL